MPGGRKKARALNTLAIITSDVTEIVNQLA